MARKLGILIALCIILAVWLWVEPTSVDPSPLKQIKTQGVRFTGNDLGRIKQLSTYTGSFQVTNQSNERIEIERIDAGCNCTKIEFDKKHLDPGEEGVVHFTLELAKLDKYDMSRLFRVNIPVYVDYFGKDKLKRVTSSSLVGSVDRVISTSKRHLHISSTAQSKRLELLGDELVVETYQDCDLSFSVAPDCLGLEVRKSGSTTRVKVKMQKPVQGIIEGNLVIVCKSTSGSILGSMKTGITACIESYNISPRTFIVDTRSPTATFQAQVIALADNLRGYKSSHFLLNDRLLTDGFNIYHENGVISFRITLPCKELNSSISTLALVMKNETDETIKITSKIVNRDPTDSKGGKGR